MKVFILSLVLFSVTAVYANDVDLTFCNPESTSKIQFKTTGPKFQFIKKNSDGVVKISKNGLAAVTDLDEEDRDGNVDVLSSLAHLDVDSLNFIKGTQYVLDSAMTSGNTTTLMILVDGHKNSYLLQYENGEEAGNGSYYLGTTTNCSK